MFEPLKDPIMYQEKLEKQMERQVYSSRKKTQS